MIITELASISTDFLENSLLSLEECLQNEQLDIRLLFVDMFASIFTQSAPSLSREWQGLFRIFLKRYDDVSLQIREFMANITKLLFQKQYNYHREITDFCMKRVEDSNERVRQEMVKQICMASCQSNININNKLYAKILQRMLDKKQSVRFTAIEYGSKLFAHHVQPYWRNGKSLPAETRKLLPIPKRLINILNSVDFNTKIHVECMFDVNMIGNREFVKKIPITDIDDIKQEIQQRMSVTLGIIALLPDENRQVFQKYWMREKYQLQQLINKILSIYDELRMAKSNKNIEIHSDDQEDDVDTKQDGDENKKVDANIIALQRQYEIAYSNFNQRFPIYGSQRHTVSTTTTVSSGSPPKGKVSQKQKPGDLLKQLIENKNSKIRHYLQNLCSPSTKLKSIYNCGKNLESVIKATQSKEQKKAQITKINEFVAALCIRLSNVLFSNDAIPVLLNRLVDIVENTENQPRALLISGIHILNSLCDELPNIFDHHDCLQQLIQLFDFMKMTQNKDDVSKRLSYVSLRILSKSMTRNSLQKKNNQHQQFLNDLIDKAKINPLYEEAQLATECLIKCTGKYSSTIKQLCNECSKELDITEQYLPTLLSTLSVIAKLSPNVFISRASHIVQFILDTLFPYDLNENDGIYQENNINDEHEDEDEPNDDDNDNESQQDAMDEDEDQDQDDDITSKKKRQRRPKRGRRARTGRTSNKNKGVKPEKTKKRNVRESPSMTPIIATAKQCGIQILVNYLLSIVDLPKDQLGIASVGISPIKTSTSSKRTSPKRKRARKSNIDLDDVIMNDVENDDDDDDTNLDDEDNDIETMEDIDPFSAEPDHTLQQPISPEIQCDRILDALFDLIRKYAQTNPDDLEHNVNTSQIRKYSRSNNIDKLNKQKPLTTTPGPRKKRKLTPEEVSLINMAVDSILDIIFQPRYRRLLGLLRFYELAFLIHHENAMVRKHTLQAFWKKLRDHKLPSHYACIFPLVAADKNKKLRDIYRPAVAKFFDRMRKENEIRRSSMASSSTLPITKLPEYLLFYLVHLLAHHPDFDEAQTKKELKQRKTHQKAKPFGGYRGGRRSKKGDESSEYDTSPSRMRKKKKTPQITTEQKEETVDADNNHNDKDDEEKKEEKKDSDKQEADDDDDQPEEQKQTEKEPEYIPPTEDPEEISCISYFSKFFDFYYDALIKGTQTNQFPLMITILNKINESYDAFNPYSKAHRYLAQIAYTRLHKRLPGQKFQDFPGHIPLPKALFKEHRTSRDRNEDQGYDSNKADISSSPRRTDTRKKRKRSRRSNRNHPLSTTDTSLLATTTASDSTALSAKKKKRGLFSTEMLRQKYPELADKEKEETERKDQESNNMDNVVEGEGSDHPSDDDIMNDMQDISRLNLSAAIQANLDESLMDSPDKEHITAGGDGGGDGDDNHNHNDEEEEEEEDGKGILSGSGAEADDETNTITESNKGKKKKTKRARNIGRKRTRTEMTEDEDITDKSDKTEEVGKEDKGEELEDTEPPKKKAKRRSRK